MCGISGIIGPPASNSSGALARQLELMRHRGPNAEGGFCAGRGAIGQTRLSIIDLQTGDPPITNEAETLAAVLNGEIYNYQALRDGLTKRGHKLRSQGDTEVIAHLAEESSAVELARRLDGMFAFAVWDALKEQLVLGRDRVGKKPLYWGQADGRLVFGSEIKAVLADPAVKRELNPRAIDAYLTFGYVPTPETFYLGIRSLPPAHVLTFRPDGEPQIERYWSLELPGPAAAIPLDVGVKEGGRLIREELKAAVARRLISDVPIGAFLSGGIDSSLIVALMSQLSSEQVRTFTIGFEDDEGFDERPHARRVARHCGTDHHECIVHPDAVELIDTLVEHHDQPFGDSSAIPTYLLSAATRSDVTVALSGDGGDELFAGYERFVAALALARYRRIPPGLRRAARVGFSRLPPNAARRRVESAQRFFEHADLEPLAAYRSWLSFFDEHRRGEALPTADDWALRDYAAVWSQSEGSDLLTRLLHLNLHTYLLDDLLVKVDRTSMAHGLEVRSPFLDAGLLQLAFRLPSDTKLCGASRKRVLRAAAQDLLPREILGRRKRGFAVPLDRWFRAELGTYLAARLGSPDARVKRHLNALVVDRLIAEHNSGARNHGQALWMLLTLELFLRREGW